MIVAVLHFNIAHSILFFFLRWLCHDDYGRENDNYDDWGDSEDAVPVIKMTMMMKIDLIMMMKMGIMLITITIIMTLANDKKKDKMIGENAIMIMMIIRVSGMMIIMLINVDNITSIIIVIISIEDDNG